MATKESKEAYYKFLPLPPLIKEILHVIRSCRNGGTFYNDSGAGKCECPDGFAGSSCQFRDLCNRDHEVCLHGATCETVSATRFQCHCVGGHFGDTCEHFNPCFLDPCRNSGVCRNLTESQYECTCTHGYFGKNCTHYNPCASFPCQNNAVCRNVTEEYYLCDCLTGYHGHECENYNPCYHDPCLFGGMCNSVDGKYVCECAYGRYGKHCEHMNLCEALLPCGENSIQCRNTSDSSYKCVCKSGRYTDIVLVLSTKQEETETVLGTGHYLHAGGGQQNGRGSRDVLPLQKGKRGGGRQCFSHPEVGAQQV